MVSDDDPLYDALDALESFNDDNAITDDEEQPYWAPPKAPRIEWKDGDSIQYSIAVFTGNDDAYRVEGEVFKDYAFERDAVDDLEFLRMRPDDPVEPVTAAADGLKAAINQVFEEVNAVDEADLADPGLGAIDPGMAAEYPESLVGDIDGYDPDDF